MNPRKLLFAITFALLTTLALPVGLAAQHTRYRLIDLETLGGPNSFSAAFSGAGAQLINNRGEAVGTSETSFSDPDYPNFNPNVQGGPDSYVLRPMVWRDDTVTGLNAVRHGRNSAAPGWISESGLIAGISETGFSDPLTGWPQAHATLWRHGQTIDLGTLGGYESFAYGLNSRGEAVGGATNTTADSFFGLGTQLRAFLFRDGEMRDLGTLGGPDAFATTINESSQISGCSLTAELIGVPFLWDGGKMINLGAFGGTIGCAFLVNSHGQLIGQSNLPGDQITHGFFWQRGVLTDLGTFGGDIVEPFWLNDLGEVVGGADYPGDTVRHAFLWKKGVLTDLGTVYPNCTSVVTGSVAISINSKSQVVGNSWCDNTDFAGFLWERSSGMVNLNELVQPTSNLQIIAATSINDRGEIVAIAFVPITSTVHAVVLIPCEEGRQNCADNATGTLRVAPPISVVLSEGIRISMLAKINARHRFPHTMPNQHNRD